MEGFETAPDQITIFYNPGNTTQEKAVAHARGTGKEVLDIPWADAPTAYNIWTRLWDAIPGDKNSIFDESDERYDALIRGREFTFDEWRKIATHNPDLIAVAMAISGEKALVLDRQTEVYRLQELGPEAAEKKVPEHARIHPDNKADQGTDTLGMMLDR